MSKNLIIPILFLAAVVFTSGCTMPWAGMGYSTTAGASIKEFSFDRTTLWDADDSAQMTFVIENVGAKNMTDDSKVWLYGPEIGTYWKISPSDKSWTIVTTGFLPPSEGRPGSVDTRSATFTPPDIPTGLPAQAFTFYLRMCYPYSSSAFAKLVQTAASEYKGELPSSDAVTRATAGPIQLTLKGKEAIRRGAKTIPLVFSVTDVGGGFATTQATACKSRTSAIVSTTEQNKVKITVRVNNVEVSGCKDKEWTVGRDFYCTYTLGTLEEPQKTYFVEAEATYNYFITKSATVTVKDSGAA